MRTVFVLSAICTDLLGGIETKTSAWNGKGESYDGVMTRYM
jgi:hypothetical protein